MRSVVALVSLSAVVAACHGLEPPDPSPSPERRLLVDPALPGGERLWINVHPSLLDPSVPWEVVRPYPPEVVERKRALWERHGGRRDSNTTIVYLAFDGEAITSSSNHVSDAINNVSWIPPSNVTIPAFDASPWSSDGTRQQVIDKIVQRLGQIYAGYNIQFTATRPSSGDYMMTVIGGSASVIGEEYGVLGVSPLDCGNYDPLEVNFIFSVSLAGFDMGLWDVVYTIAHEDAHTFGLAHINRTNDIMYYATAGGDSLSWGAAATRSGEGNCSDNNYQDDRVYLTQNIGGQGSNPETTPPTVAITSPTNGQILDSSPVTVNLTANDASGIAKIEVFVDGTLKGTAYDSPYTVHVLGVVEGTHQLMAKATDFFNNVAQSAVVSFTMAMGGPPPGCQVDADCPTGTKCQTGTCAALPPTPQRGALGAICIENEDCDSGVCVHDAQNYCTQTCSEAQNVYCPAGYACQDGFCFSAGPIPPGATGWPCAVNADCRSRICAHDAAPQGYCTETCNSSANACPNSSACADAGDGVTFVCGRPPVNAEEPPPSNNATGRDDSGCMTAGAPAAGGLAWPLPLIVLLALRRRARRPI
jgi:hypothetical protein